MQDLSTLQNIALIASTALAAVAAGASWVSVIQARKLARESNSPFLQVQKIEYEEDHTIGAVVTNAGGGMARGAGIVLTFPPYYVAGNLGHGFMQSGHTVHVRTDITITPGVQTSVVVMCRDRESFPNYWSADEDHKVFKTRWRRRPKHQTIQEAFMAFYPDIDLDQLQQAHMKVVRDP